MSLAKGFVNFVYLLKEPVFSFINLHYFFQFFFIYFYSDLYNFFPSTNLGREGGVLLFPVVLDVKLVCLFTVFLVS